MWITKLQLTNIKSYGDDSPSITFRPGVNLIQGHNGAGKSTILEAIGLALFGSRSYTQEQFVREGARTGEIVVGFMSGVDEREYEIVRGVGSGARMYVYDPAVEQRITTGIEDTAAFIRLHLRVDAETDLAALFRDAIGVPQGSMTAIFLEPARLRSETFNRLLRIDEYERAWRDLRATKQYIDDLLVENSNQQARLEGVLSELPNVVGEIGRLSGLMDQAQTSLASMDAELLALDERIRAFDTQKKQLDVLDRQLDSFRAEVQRMEDRLTTAARQVREAEEAVSVVAETQAGVDAYEQAQETLVALAADLQVRDRLLADRGAVHTDLELCRQDVARAEEMLAAVEAAEAEAARLAPLAEEQAALEESLEKAREAQAAVDRLQPQIAQAADVLAAQAEYLERLEVRLAERQADLAPSSYDGTTAADSLEAQASLAREMTDRLEGATDRFNDALAASQEAMAELARLAEQTAERQDMQARLDALTRDAEATAATVNESQVRLAQVEQEMQTLAAYEALLGEADARCPVCQRPMDEHAHADSRAHFADERQRLMADITAAEAQLVDHRAALAELTRERDALANQITALPGEAVLIMAKEHQVAAQLRLEERQDEAARLWDGARAALDHLSILLADADNHLKTLIGEGGAWPELEAALSRLGNPRRDLERAQEKASTRPDAEDSLAIQRTALGDLQSRLAAIDADLADYDDLNDRLRDNQRLRDDNQDAHQRYLARRDTAQELPARQAELAAVEEELQARQSTLVQTHAEHQALYAQYDAEAHQALGGQRDAIRQDRAGLQARLDGHDERLQDLQQRLAQLEDTRQRLDDIRRDQERLESRLEAFEFVRSSIRQAGPVITSQLVRLIGERANRFFSDILGDPGLVLHWDQDYGISISHRGEQRDFTLLSGGEQMAAAMAVRLALLTQLADVRFAFFDEPTANLDESRRDQLAQSLAGIRSLQQLFVISHDDTFEQESYHVVQVRKVNGISQVEAL